MGKIFISYNRQSEPIVRSLADDIESLSHTVWFDHELSGGQAWWDQILARVRDCSVFVFVLSPEGLNSTACRREYSYAAELGKPVLPVLVSDGVSINLLPPTLSKIEYVDYRKQDRGAAFRLARALSTIPPPGPLPDPLPKPPDAPISYLGGLTEQVDSTSTLSYQEQTALLVDLKRSLRDSESREDTRTLLQKLRKRRDLFATIAEDIDESLGSIRLEKPTPETVIADPGPVEPSPSYVPEAATFLLTLGSKSEGKPSIAAEDSDTETRVPEAHSNELTGIRNLLSYEFTIKERLIGAGIGAVAGLACGMLLSPRTYGFYYSYEAYSYYFGVFATTPLSITFSLGGAIAGAISGTNRQVIFAATAGMIVAVIYAVLGGVHYGLLNLLASPLGAIVGLIDKYRRKK